MQRSTSSIRFLSYFVPISVAGILLNGTAIASPCRTIFSSQAEGLKGSLVNLTIGPGSGLNILPPEGETIGTFFLDDMSQIGVASNGRLCEWSNETEQECQNQGASVLHLRRIKKINFPSLLRSADGSTLLTLIPDGVQSRKVYHFKVTPISKASDYQCIVIQPDLETTDSIASLSPVENPAANTSDISNQVTPVRNIQERQVQEQAPQTEQAVESNQNSFSVTQQSRQNNLNTNNYRTTAERGLVVQEKPVNSLKKERVSIGRDNSLSKVISTAQAAQKGLKIANQVDLFQALTLSWWRAKKAISYLEEGHSVQEAAEKSGLHVFLLAQLVSWGRETEASLVSSY